MDHLRQRVDMFEGAYVSYQGKNFQIKGLTDTFQKVVLTDLQNGNEIVAQIQDLLPFIENVAERNTGEHGIEALPLELVSDQDWAIAQKRFDIIRPILESGRYGAFARNIADQNGIGLATIYRWLESYESNQQLSSLIPGKPPGGVGKTRLSSELESVIVAAIEKKYLTKQRNPVREVFHEIIKECRRLDFDPPHINTVRNRISSLSEKIRMRYREGKKASDDKFRAIEGEFPRPDYPLEVVQIDHTPADVILVDDITREPVGKPFVTLAIDVYSRMVVGLYISFDPVGMLAAGMCIANSILPKEGWLSRIGIEGNWPCWGCMKTIHSDNAREFKGTMFSRACNNYGIELTKRPVKEPRFGGHVERMLRTLLAKTHTIPGTTFSNVEQKGEYNSEQNASLSISEFERWVVHFIVNIYHKRIHSGIGTRPIDKFEEGMSKRGGMPARITDERRLRLDFLPFEKRSIQQYGVRINHIYYFGDVLRKWIHAIEPGSAKSRAKREFIFKIDYRDISIIYFFDPDLKEYFEIPYRNNSYPPMTLWEYKKILARLKSAGNKNVDENLIFNAYEHLNRIQEEAVTKTQKIRRMKAKARKADSMQKSLKTDTTIKSTSQSSDLAFESFTGKIDFSNIKPYDELSYEAFN